MGIGGNDGGCGGLESSDFLDDGCKTSRALVRAGGCGGTQFPRESAPRASAIAHGLPCASMICRALSTRATRRVTRVASCSKARGFASRKTASQRGEKVDKNYDFL